MPCRRAALSRRGALLLPRRFPAEGRGRPVPFSRSGAAWPKRFCRMYACAAETAFPAAFRLPAEGALPS